MAAVADLGGTPVKAYAAQNRYTHELPAAAELQHQHCLDMSGYFVGPIGPQDFLDTFMKLGNNPGPAPALKIKPPSKNQTEREMYKSFHQAIIKSGVCTTTEFFIAADRHSVGNTKIRPDGGLKESMPAPPTNGSTSLSGRPLCSTAASTAQFDSPDTVPTAQYNFHNDGLMVEFKRQASDPFYLVRDMNKMDTPVLERPSGKARSTRGQLASYATETFAHQHRTHLFQLIVFGKYARFLYWDRSSAVVSGRFNYTSGWHPQYLAEFFWRYNHMTGAERGLDPTVTGTSDEEKKAFEVAVDKFLTDLQKRCPNHEHMAGLMNTTKATYPVRKITVQDASGKPPIELVVQRPFHHPHSPLGRGTRTYLAYSAIEGTMYILKDTWRVVHKWLLAENEVYDRLRLAGVMNVPEVFRAGDVVVNDTVQMTTTQEWARQAEARAASENLRTHHHHRILQKFAYTADTVQNSKEFILAVHDCLGTMEGARKCNMLHRDISLGNIMISSTGRGILNDWDHAGEIEHPEGYERQKFRTGTWQFISCALLVDPRKTHDMQDDLESVFWVVLYKALHDFDHEGTFNMAAFDEREAGPSYDKGGRLKRAMLAEIPLTIKFSCAPLHNLICDLAEKLSDYHESINKRERAVARGRQVPAVLETHLTELRESLSSPVWWQEEFRQALATKGWPMDDIVPDQYPQKTKVAHTIDLFNVRESAYKRISTSEIPQSIDGIERGSDLKKLQTIAQIEAQHEFRESVLDDSIPYIAAESSEVPCDTGNIDDFELEEGDTGGEDLPPSNILRDRPTSMPKLGAVLGQRHKDKDSKLAPAPQHLPMLPPASSRFTLPPSSHLFSANGSAFSIPPSSAGTKRSLSDFSEDDNDVGASPRSKRARPAARADLIDLQLAGGVPSRSPSRRDRASRSCSRGSNSSL